MVHMILYLQDYSNQCVRVQLLGIVKLQVRALLRVLIDEIERPFTELFRAPAVVPSRTVWLRHRDSAAACGIVFHARES